MVLCKPLIWGLIYQPLLVLISEDISEHLQVLLCVPAMPAVSLGRGRHLNRFQRGSELAVEGGGFDGSPCYIWLFGKGILAETVLPSETPVDIIYTLI